MRKTLIIAVILFGVLTTLLLGAFKFLVIGFHSTSDASNDKELWGGYEHQREYVLVMDVFLQRSSQGMAESGRFVLVPARSDKKRGGFESSPETIAAYEADPERAAIDSVVGFKLDVVGIVRKGTRLRATRLDRHDGWSLWTGGSTTMLTPWAEILDGEYAGSEVDLTDVSEFTNLPKVDGIFVYEPENLHIKAVEP